MHPDDTTWTAATRTRTSDTEREQVADILRAAMAEGRLDLTEGEERLAAAYGAKFRDELAPLTADLPDGGRQALARTPQARAATRRSLQRHISFAAIAAGVLIGLWLLSGAGFFWPIFPIVFLLIGIKRHAREGRFDFRRSYVDPHACR